MFIELVAGMKELRNIIDLLQKNFNINKMAENSWNTK